MNVVILVTALAVAGVLALHPRVRASRAWRATVTPLSSIMGSGFLVSAPLLAAEVGAYAPFAMGGLLLVAFGMGALIRFNIRYAEPELDDAATEGQEPKEHWLHRGHREGSRPHWAELERDLARRLEQASHVVLAGAYIVSITYYVALLSTFVLDRFGIHDLVWSRILASSLLGAMALVGAAWGLRALERLEAYAISLNLGMITALLVALMLHDGSLAVSGGLAIPALPRDPDATHAARVVLGLLIVVQGFETSRFLGAEHPADERARTMRVAQLLASVIYLVFVTLMLPLFEGQALDADVTAIVSLVAPVAMVLPVLIVVAAIGSQLSAAVADDAGCAGLLHTLLRQLSPRGSYLGIGGLAIGVTWLTDVLSVITLASRAFALFYALQCAVAAVTAYRTPDAPNRGLVIAGGGAFTLVALAITVLGIPAE
ncbi:MAG: hypothetical protein H6719_17200 [Sandaracinaceae bacterium]|nr:hypothetical protein [Sandaracinaceae bacterium]